MIDLRNGSVVKGGRKLFENLSWSIDDNEHWVISGPNGCGKTTLLEVLSGNVHLPVGELHFSFIKGETWDERYAARRKLIHYLPTHAIQSFLSDAQPLYYQQRYYDIGDERIPKVKDILGTVSNGTPLSIPSNLSIAHLMDLEVTRLSNGQLKKLLLLKVLMAGIPKLLLLDYPFEGLDHDSRQDLCDYIDLMARTYGVQFIIADDHHHLPQVINRRLMLDNFRIIGVEDKLPVPSDTAVTMMPRIDTSENDRVVEIKDLRIKYDDHIVLDHFNWTVRQGERWALVGKNGAGKTTLFSMIFADHPMAYSQEIYLFGRKRGSGESIWEIKRRIAYMGPELISYLSPRSIGLSAIDYIRSMNKKLNEDSLLKMVSHFSANDFINQPVRQLSSGQLQLMLIMNCFLTEKELLLLDEPFQFLDGVQKRNLAVYLQTYLHSETTLILITHYEKDLAEWTNHTKRI